MMTAGVTAQSARIAKSCHTVRLFAPPKTNQCNSVPLPSPSGGETGGAVWRDFAERIPSRRASTSVRSFLAWAAGTRSSCNEPAQAVDVAGRRTRLHVIEDSVSRFCKTNRHRFAKLCINQRKLSAGVTRTASGTGPQRRLSGAERSPEWLQAQNTVNPTAEPLRQGSGAPRSRLLHGLEVCHRRSTLVQGTPGQVSFSHKKFGSWF